MLVKVNVFCGSRMRTARIIWDYDYSDLKDLTGISEKDLMAFEKGVKQPSKAEEEKIANALNVKPVFFYYMNTSPITEEDCTFSPRMRRVG